MLRTIKKATQVLDLFSLERPEWGVSEAARALNLPKSTINTLIDEGNVNLMTCGAQATVPMAYAVSRVTSVRYAEMVSTVASASAGPGTRQNIDEFTFTTARGLEEIGGAQDGKAIIILNPADPPLIMRNTVYVVPDAEREEVDEEAITESVN